MTCYVCGCPMFETENHECMGPMRPVKSKEVDLARENAELRACGHKRQYEASWGDAESTHCSLCMVLRLHEQNRGLESSNVRLREALTPFATGGVIDCLSREDYSIMRERIVDWHGPTDYLKARDSLAETPAAGLEAIRADAISTVIESLKGYPEAKGDPGIYKEVARLSLEAIEQTADVIRAAAKAEEREACAKIADDACCLDPNCNECDGVAIAEAIRALGDAGEKRKRNA